MKPYHWTIIGLILDIIGAFFLAVEAIKVDNLKKIKIKVLFPLRKIFQSPKIEWVDEESTNIKSPKWYFYIFYFGLHNLAGIFFLFGLNFFLNGELLNWFLLFKNWVRETSWYLFLPTIVLCFVIMFCVSFLLGELVHKITQKAVEISLESIDFIESNTPTGTVGIIGFLFLFLGFVLQMLSAYLAGTATPN